MPLAMFADTHSALGLSRLAGLGNVGVGVGTDGLIDEVASLRRLAALIRY